MIFVLINYSLCNNKNIKILYLFNNNKLILNVIKENLNFILCQSKKNFNCK